MSDEYEDKLVAIMNVVIDISNILEISFLPDEQPITLDTIEEWLRHILEVLED